MVNQFGYSKWLVCLGILAMLLSGASCSNVKGRGVSSPKFRRPYRDVRKAVYYAMQGKVSRSSENGRTFYSPWHQPGKSLNSSSYKKPKRAQLQITILSDRRPYWVKVVYRIEERDGNSYDFDRYDKKVAQSYLNKIEDYLASRPEERDVIDDFRPY